MALTNHILPDSPTNNFATLNPLYNGNGTGSFSNGNLYSGGDATNWVDISGTFSVSSLKWYWEVFPYDQYIFLGIISQDYVSLTDPHIRSNQISIYGANGQNLGDNAGTYFTYGGTDIISILVDLESTQRVIKYFKNGTTSPVATINIPTSYTSVTPVIMISGTTTAYTKFNFGQDPSFGDASSLPTAPSGSPFTDANGIGAFYYQPPTGALALCTANLPDFTPDVDDDTPQDYFKAVTYQASGVNNQIQNVNVGFQPDLIWIKNRDNNETHYLTDTIRSSLTNDRLDKFLCSNETSTEATVSNRVSETTITSKSYGFDISDSDMSSGELYFGTRKYVAWCWKAGDAPTADNTATSGAMDANSVSLNGTLQSNYTPAGSPTIYPKRMSINTDAGFSIVKWQASNGSDKTVPHGLSNSLDMIVMKNLDTGTYGWHVSHVGLTTNHNLLLNNTDQSWNPFTGGWVEVGTGGVFNIKNGTNGTNTNNGTDNYIAYCWHSVEGYSKFGSYTGNGSPDGTFVYCGFRPAFVMIKEIADQSWFMYDSSRDLYNPSFHTLLANQSAIEETNHSYDLDILSNGWKMRNNNFRVNDTSGTYIFMAFAEQPFNYANSR